jgi:hypothetical protein
MTEQQYQHAVQLWTVLIAQWLTDHPPEPSPETEPDA